MPSLDSHDSNNINSTMINKSIQLTNTLLDHGILPKLCNDHHASDSGVEEEFIKLNIANNISVTIIPFNKQIVLDGRICRSDLFAQDGSCDFDRSQIEIDEGLVEDSDNLQQISDNSNTESNNSSSSSTAECPVCKFMKNGECKEQFVKWDDCMSKIKEEDDVRICYGQTVTMMECMKKHEYYDIMIAGTSYKTD
jgi:hypothetical protein